MEEAMKPVFIKLSMKVNRRAMWFNTKLITAIGETSDGSAVIYSVGNDVRCVHETPQVVMEKIAEASYYNCINK
jgi:hypothetical protein